MQVLRYVISLDRYLSSRTMWSGPWTWVFQINVWVNFLCVIVLFFTSAGKLWHGEDLRILVTDLVEWILLAPHLDPLYQAVFPFPSCCECWILGLTTAPFFNELLLITTEVTQAKRCLGGYFPHANSPPPPEGAVFNKQPAVVWGTKVPALLP